MSRQQKRSNSQEILRFAGLGTQIFVSLGITVYAGLKADRWLDTSFPLLVWLLPLIVLSVMIYNMVRETSKKKNKIERES